METRELFWNVDGAAYSAFYAIGFTAIAIFIYGFARHFVKYARGQKAQTPVNAWRGFWRMWVDLFSQRTVRRRDRYAGVSHSKIFYGFVILFIGTSIITVDYDITEPLFGVTFWHGTFYLIFSLVLDIGGLGMIIGIGLMMWRRASFKLPKLDYVRGYRDEAEPRPVARYWQREDWVFMTVLLVIAVTGQQVLDATDQLVQIKRLGHVLVRTHIKPLGAVLWHGSGAENQNRQSVASGAK